MFNQGIILWNQGKIAEAKVKFEETLKANPTHADAHYQLGMALLNEGKLAEAVAEFESYVKLAPDGQYADAGEGHDRAAEEVGSGSLGAQVQTCTNTSRTAGARFASASRTRPAAPGARLTTSG